MKELFKRYIWDAWRRHLGVMIALALLAAALGAGMAVARAEENTGISWVQIAALVSEWKEEYSGEWSREVAGYEADKRDPSMDAAEDIQPYEISKEEALALAVETVCEMRRISDIGYFSGLVPRFGYDPVYRIWKISLLPLNPRTSPEWSYWVSIEARTGDLYDYRQREPNLDSGGQNPCDFAPDLVSEFTVDIRLQGRATAFFPDGSIVLIGGEGDQSNAYIGKSAIAVCVNAHGDELWRYVEQGPPGTIHHFFDVYTLGNGDVLIYHSVTHPEYSMQSFALQVRGGELVSRTELKESSGVTGVNGGYIISEIERSTVTDVDVIHYTRMDMYSQNNELLWSKVYDVPFWGMKVISLPEGFYLIGSVTDNSMVPATSRGYAAKMNAEGDIEWSHSYPISNSRFMDAVLQDDGGILIVGGVYQADDRSTPTIGCSASYSQSGEKRWEKTYGEFTDNALDAVAWSKNGYLVASAQRRIRMGLLNEDGDLITQWEESQGDDLRHLDVALYNTSHGTYQIFTVDLAYNEDAYNPYTPDVPQYYQAIVRQIE